MSHVEDYYAAGHGPATKVSVSLRLGSIRAIKERVGARGFSAYVDAAIARQIERDLLEEALQFNETEHGPIPQEFRDEAKELFRSLRAAPEVQEGGAWPANGAR